MPLAQILFANNDQSNLAGSISNTATSANLAAGTGVLFPSPGQNQYFIGTFVSASNPQLNEIVHVTNVSGDTITMVRAQEGTTALDWNANDFFSNLLTAGAMQAMQQTGGILTTPTSFYVNASTGSDSNDGLTSGTAWLTLQHAWNTILFEYNLNGQTVTVNCTGAFTTGLIAQGPLSGQLSPGSFVWNFTTGSSVTVTNAYAILAASGASFTIQAAGSGVQIGASGTGANQGGGVVTLTGGTINIGANVFLEDCAIAGILLQGGEININANTEFAGTVGQSAVTMNGGTLSGGSSTITFGAGITYSIATMVIEGIGYAFMSSASWAGSTPTGSKFSVTQNSVLTGSAAVPGSAAGTTSSGGQAV